MLRTTLLSVVIPIKNEEAILWTNACILADMLDKLVGKDQWQFILIDNNSTDNSKLIIEKIIATWAFSKSVFEINKGYSAALRSGLHQVDTPFALIVDIEQWDIPFIVWAWSNRAQHDVFIGSKRADPLIAKQRFYRKLLSFGLNSCLKLFFDFPGTDTHGQKLIRMQSMKKIIEKCEMRRSLFDTEMVLRARRQGCSIAEAAVVFNETRPSRNLMITKIFWNVVGMMQFFKIMRQVPVVSLPRYSRFTRGEVMDGYNKFYITLGDG